MNTAPIWFIQQVKWRRYVKDATNRKLVAEMASPFQPKTAALLCAAPQMLEALQFMSNQLDLEEPTQWEEARHKVYRAIALAQGISA